MSELSIAGLLLAAGESRRMGEINKMLLPVGRRTLLARSVEVFGQCELDARVVVLGHDLPQTAPVVSATGLPWIINSDYQHGQQSSIRAGLRALGPAHHAYLVMLADLPFITVSTVDSLVAAVHSNPNADAWVPTYGDATGNPRIISRAWCNRLIEDPDLPSRALFSQFPDSVVAVSVDSDSVLCDVDTPDDYQRVVKKLSDQSNGFR